MTTPILERRAPVASLEVLAEWATSHLSAVIAIDSQSDESSEAIPSTEGQRVLSDALRAFFGELGFEATQDRHANLIVHVPATVPDVPAIALMVHMDTSEGTQAVDALCTVPAWDGRRVPYPANDFLQVSVAGYPETGDFLGQDLLHGPGTAPIGLDDKVGMAELMTLARLLAEEPGAPHGDVYLVFRPDEEIGRMAAVEGLADRFGELGVRFGYTIDGMTPFEVNVENFNAARARIRFAGRPVATGADPRHLRLRVTGVKTHGATAKAEGHLNATVILARALATLGDRAGLQVVGFRSDPAAETDGELDVLVWGDRAAEGERALVAALEAEVAPHAWRGARLARLAPADIGPPATDGVHRAAAFVSALMAGGGPAPVLCEESDRYQGYSNPYAIVSEPDGGTVLEVRLRDFDPDQLRARGEHVRALADAVSADAAVEDQYVNMGPRMANWPELPGYAEAAARAIGVEVRRQPIRGGTGVDPFLTRGIPIANLGTGYFAPESEKELTSRQQLARHSLWLFHLVQTIAGA